MPPRMRQRGAEAQEQPCAGQLVVGRGAGVELQGGIKGRAVLPFGHRDTRHEHHTGHARVRPPVPHVAQRPVEVGELVGSAGHDEAGR